MIRQELGYKNEISTLLHHNNDLMEENAELTTVCEQQGKVIEGYKASLKEWENRLDQVKQVSLLGDDISKLYICLLQNSVLDVYFCVLCLFLWPFIVYLVIFYCYCFVSYVFVYVFNTCIDSITDLDQCLKVENMYRNQLTIIEKKRVICLFVWNNCLI